MTDLEYRKLLKKFQDQSFSRTSDDDRFKLPEIEIFYEGNTSVIKNFDKISDAMNREPDEILKFLLGGLGTAGERSGSRLIFQGKIRAEAIQTKLKDYLDTFVMCSECGKPDTHLVKRGRNTIVRCDACGAIRPLKSQKHMIEKKPAMALKEDGIYEVTIKDIGKKGDGVAFYGKYIIYIPGVIKGATVKVKVEKISGIVAFAKMIKV